MKLFISKLHYKKTLTNLDRLVSIPLWMASLPYEFIVRCRNFLYAKNILKSVKPNAYVVSVGNLTTGGVGKTPIVNAIAEYLNSKGNKVCILSRGYNSKLDSAKANIISDGSKILIDSSLAGDEPYWHAKNSPKSCVITSASRVKGAKLATEELHCNIIVLDDAFQHQKIKRDVNILAVDCEKLFGNNMLLPLGPLREPILEVKRADKIIVVSKTLNQSKMQKTIECLQKITDKPIFTCSMKPDSVYNIITGELLSKETPIIAFCAIGQPSQFYNFLKDDYDIVATTDFEDHHDYSVKDVQSLFELCVANHIRALVTTEKDAVKLTHIIEKLTPTIKVYALKLKADIDIEGLLHDEKNTCS